MYDKVEVASYLNNIHENMPEKLHVKQSISMNFSHQSQKILSSLLIPQNTQDVFLRNVTQI